MSEAYLTESNGTGGTPVKLATTFLAGFHQSPVNLAAFPVGLLLWIDQAQLRNEDRVQNHLSEAKRGMVMGGGFRGRKKSGR